MAKKVLIIGSKENECVCRSIAQVLTLIDAESDIVIHDDALAKFLDSEYDLVVISDYSEKINKERGGFASYRDILASATGQKIVRCGFETLDHLDYIRYPCLVPELFKKLGEKQK